MKAHLVIRRLGPVRWAFAIVLGFAAGFASQAADRRAPSQIVVVLATLLTLVCWAVVQRLILSQLFSRRYAGFLAALDSDPKPLRAAFDGMADVYEAVGMAPDFSLLLHSAVVLSQEQCWPEARRVLATIAPASLEKLANLMAYENNLAWVLAHDGAPDEAAALAERLLARLSESDPKHARLLRQACGTLGTALTLAGRPAEAIGALRRATDGGESAGAEIVRQYYLGLALRALGRADEARAAWLAAQRADATHPWAQLAAKRLSEDIPHAYR